MRVFAILATLAAVAGCAAEAPTLSDVLERHAEARGGEAALEGVASIEVSLRIKEPTFEVDGVYRATRDELMRIDIFADGRRVFSEGLDADGAWQMDNAGTVTSQSDAGRESLRRGVVKNLYGLHELPAGYGLTLAGTEEIDGVDYYAVEKTDPTGAVETLYFHPETYLIDYTGELKALHPDADPTVSRFRARKYDQRRVDGILYPFGEETHNLDTGEWVQTMTVTSLTFNPPIDDVEFARPE